MWKSQGILFSVTCGNPVLGFEPIDGYDTEVRDMWTVQYQTCG